MCLADSRLFLPGLNLAYTDRASMAASTEVRVPFVDPTVVAAAFSIPGPTKIRGRTGKAALKEAAAAWLPQEIVHRPEGVVQRPAAGLDLPGPEGRWSTRSCSSGELVGERLPPSRAAGAADRSTSATAARTIPSRSGSC